MPANSRNSRTACVIPSHEILFRYKYSFYPREIPRCKHRNRRGYPLSFNTFKPHRSCWMEPSRIRKRNWNSLQPNAGIDREFFGLLTAVPVQQCCILQYDYVTVFITAGVRREPPANAGTINIIVCSNEGMEDAALLETIMVATEAKAEALTGNGLPTHRYSHRCRDRRM